MTTFDATPMSCKACCRQLSSLNICTAKLAGRPTGPGMTAYCGALHAALATLCSLLHGAVVGLAFALPTAVCCRPQRQWLLHLCSLHLLQGPLIQIGLPGSTRESLHFSFVWITNASGTFRRHLEPEWLEYRYHRSA